MSCSLSAVLCNRKNSVVIHDMWTGVTKGHKKKTVQIVPRVAINKYLKDIFHSIYENIATARQSKHAYSSRLQTAVEKLRGLEL